MEEAIGPFLIACIVLVLGVFALLMPLVVWQIMLNTRAMRRDLRRLADEAEQSLRE